MSLWGWQGPIPRGQSRLRLQNNIHLYLHLYLYDVQRTHFYELANAINTWDLLCPVRFVRILTLCVLGERCWPM